MSEILQLILIFGLFGFIFIYLIKSMTKHIIEISKLLGEEE
jgi:hypothetical protein